jgi:RecA-family ATPase
MTQGPTMYIGCEDDGDELWRRMQAICAHMDVGYRGLVDGGFHATSWLGEEDTILVRIDKKTGEAVLTEKYMALLREVRRIRPINLSIDTLSRVFDGNELNRVEVYKFVSCMQYLALQGNCSVTILSHPSLSGIASGSGISGSTAWHGAFRFRQYLTPVLRKAVEGTLPPDTGERLLEFKKNQYGPRGTSIRLHYKNGLFVPVTMADGAARIEMIDNRFMDLLARFTREGRSVSSRVRADNYAPKLFSVDIDAEGVTAEEFAAAMHRLSKTALVRLEVPYGYASRGWARIEIV